MTAKTMTQNPETQKLIEEADALLAKGIVNSSRKKNGGIPVNAPIEDGIASEVIYHDYVINNVKYTLPVRVVMIFQGGKMVDAMAAVCK